MNEINNIVEELSYIRQEFEKFNRTLTEIKVLLTPSVNSHSYSTSPGDLARRAARGEK